MVVVVLGGLLALVYVWRIVEHAYFRDPAPGNEAVTEAPAGMLITTWVLVIANVYFGINTDLTVGVAERAAQALMGVSP